MIGERIKLARENTGLSLRALADKVDVTAMAISKYERNTSTPSSHVMMSLAKALGVRTDYFFRETRITLEDVDFRNESGLSKKEHKQLMAEVHDQLERWLELEPLLAAPWSTPFKLPDDLPKKINSLNAIEDIAIQIRQHWHLGLNPIADLTEELENEGLKVFFVKNIANKKFNGMTAKANGNPVVILSENWPGDRQRFTLAHELGHIVLKGRLANTIDEEKACHRFAGALLVPKQQALATLGANRHSIEPREFFLLKHEWGLSMNAWLFRAQDLKIINRPTAQKLWGLFTRNGWRQNEPGEVYPSETTNLFEQLVYRALAEERINDSKAAELMGLSLSKFHAARTLAN